MHDASLPPSGRRGGWLTKVCTTSLLMALLCEAGRAGDWPQILGPNRTGKAAGEHLTAWPKSGPQLLWSHAVGEGFAGPAVVGQRVIAFHRPGSELVVEALDTTTGTVLWKTSLPSGFRGSISPDSGPRCVPLVFGDRIFLIGPGGELACLALDTGKTLWSRNVQREFKASEGYFGFGSSPIVEGDKLLLNVGGRNAGIVAFSVSDGKTLWTATDEDASYSSPNVVTLDGVRQVIFVTRLNVVSVDPRQGKVLFQFPFGQRGPTVNAATPLVLNKHLFVSASYGVGARWIKLQAAAPEELWESDNIMSSQYTTCVEKNGVLYGIDGRQDVGVARLRAFDPVTQKVFWTEEEFGTGNLILAGDRLLILKTDGTLILANPTPTDYAPLAETTVFDTTAQALPALSNGRLFARDTATLKCLQVGESTRGSR